MSESPSAQVTQIGKKRPAEEVSEGNHVITLKVKSQEKEVFFQVKRTAKLYKVLRMFCAKARVEYSTMRFFYDGENFPVKSTPDQLHMRDGDEIEAMTHCGGGGNVTVA